MKKMIKAEIYNDGEYYCGKCLDFDVFTQGKTLDEVINNLKEAIQLHFEDDRDALVDSSSLSSHRGVGSMGRRPESYENKKTSSKFCRAP